MFPRFVEVGGRKLELSGFGVAAAEDLHFPGLEQRREKFSVCRIWRGGGRSSAFAGFKHIS